MKITVVLALLVCLLASVAAGSDADVATLAAAYANPTLGPAARIEKVSIVISNMSIELTAGTAAPVLAGGETVGLFFSGKGTYMYRSTDRLETGLMEFEGKKAGRRVDGNSVKGSFERLYLLAGGIALPKIPDGARDEVLEQTFKAHREHWSGSLMSPSAHLLLRQRIDAPSAKVAVAEIAGHDEDEYVLDSLEEREEGLYAMLTLPSGTDVAPVLRDAIFPIQIAGQPVGRDRGNFVQPLFLLTALDYALTAGDNDAATLSVTESIVPRGAPQSAFRFDLESGVYDDRSNYRKLEVNAVTDGAGNKLPYHFAHGSIIVGLPAKMPVNTPFTLHFQISGNILYRLGNGNAWQLGTDAWFPRPGLNGQFYTVHSVVKVKKPWLPFTPGDTVTRTEQGDFNTVESTVTKPVQFAVAHAGKYTVFENKYDDITIRVATYNGANTAAAKQLSELANQIIKFYEPWLGTFPFKEYNIIEINDLGWGQAPPGTMFMTREAFSPMLGDENRAYSKGVNERFAHEIAHQYWGIVVKMGTHEEQWITEAFAEYCAGQVVKQMQGESGYKILLNTWRSNAKDAGSFAPIPLANRVAIPWSSATINRTGLIYDKGALLLEALHKQIGDEQFLNVMRTIQGRYAWRFLTTNQVEEVFAHFDPKTDYHAFFQRYYWGTETPDLK